VLLVVVCLLLSVGIYKVVGHVSEWVYVVVCVYAVSVADVGGGGVVVAVVVCSVGVVDDGDGGVVVMCIASVHTSHMKTCRGMCVCVLL